ncbi:MAG: diacylglycerol kinase family protein [Planctomycetota bacterium]|jgi:diacylglycerol kinase (ATP)
MNKRFSIFRRIESVRYALQGIGSMLRTQHNAWLHAAATVAAIGAGIALAIRPLEWVAVIVVIVAVWTAEALNTAFEALCDAASPDFHPKVKEAKDVAAGAVLISAMGAVVVGGIVFGPKLYHLLI